MFLPIGLDETRLSRLPWVSIGIVALNLVVFLGTAFGSADRQIETRYEAVVRYWARRPYLKPSEELRERFGIDARHLAGEAEVPADAPAPPTATLEQGELDRLCQELVDAIDAAPERRFGLVPARGLAQAGWITHAFMHAGFMHLLGNMLVFFLVVGPFLEDAWGRPFYLAFYLSGALLAGMAQALPVLDSQVPIVGASGAISACLGAFALRFAHRRVRVFYWLLLFVRGTFFVPVWLYAFFGLAMDLLGLKTEGAGGGVAYGAHVGGFVFGLAAALGLRLSGLEARLTPEGAAPPSRTLGGARAADALVAGRLHDARTQYEAVLRGDPDDIEALTGLARITATTMDRTETSRHVERLVVRHLTANLPEQARAVLLELGEQIDPAAWRPATAFRASEILGGGSPRLAEQLDEVACRGTGALGAKANLRVAERLRAADPERALEAAERVLALDGVPRELARRASALGAELRQMGGRAAPAPPDERFAPIELAPAPPAGSPALPAGMAMRVALCRLTGLDGSGLQLSTWEGRRAALAFDRVAAVGAGLLAEFTLAGEPLRNRVLLDLLVGAREGEQSRVVVRIPGHAMPLATLFPGVPPQEAYGRLVDAILAASGARAAPSPAEAAGRPLARFTDVAAFEVAVWGRRVSG